MRAFNFIGVFIASLVSALLVTLYTRKVIKDRWLMPAIYHGLIMALGSYQIVIFAADPINIIPNCAGAVIGTPLAMIFDKWLDEKEKVKI